MKKFLSFRIENKNEKIYFFNFSWLIIWKLIKYKVRGKIYMSAIKALDREEHFISFYSEK